MNKPTKLCPHCGKEILAVAKKCKHCGQWLDSQKESDLSTMSDNKSDEIEPYETSTKNTSAIFIVILLVIAFIIAIVGINSYK